MRTPALVSPGFVGEHDRGIEAAFGYPGELSGCRSEHAYAQLTFDTFGGEDPGLSGLHYFVSDGYRLDRHSQQLGQLDHRTHLNPR
jgi:hypothetical protein